MRHGVTAWLAGVLAVAGGLIVLAPPSVRDGAALVWTGSELIAWGGCGRKCTPTAGGFASDPARNRWNAPLALPLDFSECYPDSVAVRDRVFAFFCGQMALYDGRWHKLGGGPPEVRAYRHPVTLTVGEGVVFLSLGSADSLWVYRPPG